MIKKINQGLFILFAMIITISSCKKTDPTPTPTPTPTIGSFKLAFEHVFGMMEEPFTLNTQFVHPMTGDTLNFNKFRYYVSNIKIKKDDGTWWSEANSYHIVDLAVSGTEEIELKDIPSGSYTELQYTLGVDSLHNVSGAQEGALSVTEGMFWNWNSGYIMLKAEGTSPNSSNGIFQFHLGGFSGAQNIVTVKSTTFNGETLTISYGNTPHVHVKANPAKLWHASPSVSSVNTIHMPGSGAKTMADNFYGSFAFEEIHQ